MKLNLHLFDTYTQVTTMTSSTAPYNDLSPEMKTYYEKKLLTLAEPDLVYNQFGDKYPIPKNNGKNIEFRKFDKLAKVTTALTEGVTPDGQNMNVTAITATVAQYGGWIRQSDMLELTAIDNTIVQANKMLAQQAAKSIDTLTRDVVCGGTNVIYAPTWSGTTATEVTSRGSMDTTSAMSRDLVEKAYATLSAQNAPMINGYYVAIVHPYVEYDLRASQGWIDVIKYAKPEEMLKGEIGQLAGIRFVKSSEAKIEKDTTCPINTTAAPAFSASSTYEVGKLCSKDGKVYKCSTAITTAGAWDATKWTEQTDGTGRLAVFDTMVLGANAYGVTEVDGGGLEFIVKQKGSAGTADPLDQRSSIGWKTTHVAKRLIEQYMVRIESISAYSGKAAKN